MKKPKLTADQLEDLKDERTNREIDRVIARHNKEQDAIMREIMRENPNDPRQKDWQKYFTNQDTEPKQQVKSLRPKRTMFGWVFAAFDALP